MVFRNGHSAFKILKLITERTNNESKTKSGSLSVILCMKFSFPVGTTILPNFHCARFLSTKEIEFSQFCNLHITKLYVWVITLSKLYLSSLSRAYSLTTVGARNILRGRLCERHMQRLILITLGVLFY